MTYKCAYCGCAIDEKEDNYYMVKSDKFSCLPCYNNFMMKRKNKTDAKFNERYKPK